MFCIPRICRKEGRVLARAVLRGALSQKQEMKKKLKQYEIELEDKAGYEALADDLVRRLRTVKNEEKIMRREDFGPKEERKLNRKKELLMDCQNLLRLQSCLNIDT